MSEEWTKKQQDDITRLFNEVSHLPNYSQIKDKVTKDVFPNNGILPYEQAKSILEHYLSGHGGLENKISTLTKEQNGVGLIGMLGSLAAFSMGLHPLGIIGLLATGTYLWNGNIPKYKAAH